MECIRILLSNDVPVAAVLPLKAYSEGARRKRTAGEPAATLPLPAL